MPVQVSVRHDITARHVPVGEGVWLPPRFTAVPYLPDGRRTAEVDIEVRDGRPVVVGVRFTGSELSRDDLRLPLASIVEAAARVVAMVPPAEGLVLGRGPEADRAAATTRTKRPYWRLDDALLEDVARLYREAIPAKVSPRKRIADKFNVSKSTARRWISEAREHEPPLLGPSITGVAGEAEPTG